MAGNCLAGETCSFSHDPSAYLASMNINSGSTAGTPSSQYSQSNIQLQDYENFPSLGGAVGEGSPAQYGFSSSYNVSGLSAQSPAFRSVLPRITNGYTPSRPSSRPSSRHAIRPATPNKAPSVDDPDAFPTLASLSAKGNKKHHGRRGGHGHREKESVPNSLADVVRMSPSPSPAQARKGLKTGKSFTSSREDSAAAKAIPAPQHVPWLETGAAANQQYLKARQDAIKHGSMRNKFLQR